MITCSEAHTNCENYHKTKDERIILKILEDISNDIERLSQKGYHSAVYFFSKNRLTTLILSLVDDKPNQFFIRSKFREYIDEIEKSAKYCGFKIKRENKFLSEMLVVSWKECGKEAGEMTF